MVAVGNTPVPFRQNKIDIKTDINCDNGVTHFRDTLQRHRLSENRGRGQVFREESPMKVIAQEVRTRANH